MNLMRMVLGVIDFIFDRPVAHALLRRSLTRELRHSDDVMMTGFHVAAMCRCGDDGWTETNCKSGSGFWQTELQGFVPWNDSKNDLYGFMMAWGVL